MLESRPERIALGVAPDKAVVVVDVGLNFLRMSKKITERLKNPTSNKTNGPGTISASDFAQQQPCFDLHKRDLFSRPDQNMKLGIGFA